MTDKMKRPARVTGRSTETGDSEKAAGDPQISQVTARADRSEKQAHRLRRLLAADAGKRATLRADHPRRGVSLPTVRALERRDPVKRSGSLAERILHFLLCQSNLVEGRTLDELRCFFGPHKLRAALDELVETGRVNVECQRFPGHTRKTYRLLDREVAS
jgi:hypothetical protein